MKTPNTKHYTSGLNSLSLTAAMINGAVILGLTSPLWLLLGIPLTLFALGLELQGP